MRLSPRELVLLVNAVARKELTVYIPHLRAEALEVDLASWGLRVFEEQVGMLDGALRALGHEGPRLVDLLWDSLLSAGVILPRNVDELVELMEECGWLGGDVWFAHGIHFTDAELAKLRATNTGICHCPTSNMRLGSGCARIPEMLSKGIRVGLGVDGSASNDTSDMLGELRNCFLLHRLVGGSQAITTRQVLRMATQGGASLLGRDDIGTIEVGKCADVIGIRVTDISHAGAIHDLIGSLILCGSCHNVAFTIVNGKFVVRDGNLVTVSEDEIVARANKIARHLRNI